MRTRVPSLLLTLAAGLTACGDPSSVADITGADPVTATAADRGGEPADVDRHAPAYRVTVTNLTDGQPFTPPLIAVHRRAASLFTVGEPASVGVQQIAENGNLEPMLMHLEATEHVVDIAVAVAGDPPPLMPGQSVSAELDGPLGAGFLSFISMLVCTNDGFTGVNRQRLPNQVGESVALELGSYDAGTEINTEDFADLVPPCPVLTGVETDDEGTGMSDPDLAEGGVVHTHPGIEGDDDLDPAVHGWTDPVARIEIERIR